MIFLLNDKKLSSVMTWASLRGQCDEYPCGILYGLECVIICTFLFLKLKDRRKIWLKLLLCVVFLDWIASVALNRFFESFSLSLLQYTSRIWCVWQSLNQGTSSIITEHSTPHTWNMVAHSNTHTHTHTQKTVSSRWHKANHSWHSAWIRLLYHI